MSIGVRTYLPISTCMGQGWWKQEVCYGMQSRVAVPSAHRWTYRHTAWFMGQTHPCTVVQEEQRKAGSAKEEGVGVGSYVACCTLYLVRRIDDLLKFLTCSGLEIGCNYSSVILESVCLIPAL